MALVGTVWPNGSAERLAAAATQWSRLSEGIAAARTTAMGSAAGTLGTMTGPTVAAATDRTRELDTGLSDLAAGATELSTACNDLAGHIEEAHVQAQNEFLELLRDTAITAAVSAGLSFVTFGAGALVGGAAATIRVTATAGRLASLFQRLASLARTVADRIRRIKEALDGLAGRISQWLTGRLPQPVRRLGEAAEKAADHWTFTLATNPLALAAKLAGKVGEAGARRALVLGWNRSSHVRTAISRTAGARSGPASGEAGAAPAIRSVVSEAMRRGEDTTLARLVGGSREAVTQEEGKLIPKTEEKAPTGAEGESSRQRIADMLGIPAGAWPSFSPEPIRPVPGVTLDLAAGKVTGPGGLEAELTLPGEAGAQLSAAAKLAKAATLENNFWLGRIDGAAHAGSIEFSPDQPAAPAAQATGTPAEQPAQVGS